MKDIEEIRRRLERGEAVVMAAPEFKALVRAGERPAADEVDIVTCATVGVMSGTMAVLSVPVADAGAFGRATALRLNGVPAHPGPCPNERLGLVDAVVYGTAHADRRYGGGHLIADLAAGREIRVEASTDAGDFEARITIDDLTSARLVTTRSAFRNYTAFVNRSEGSVRTIFSATGLSGPLREASVSGCGEINPLQNDPALRTIRPGSGVLANGAPGYVMGEGTRSTTERPNIAVFADIRGMDPCTCGGFVTAAGPECITSVAAAIPVLDDASIAVLSVLDADIPLPVVDIADRTPFAAADYGQVWGGTDRTVTYDPAACAYCEACAAGAICPTGAFLTGEGVDPCLCASCGACAVACTGGAVTADLGALEVGERRVPITIRQSDRKRAEDLCYRLKNGLLNGKYQF
ncbi:methanogenesis marker 16 metalloprotein [Methanofollis fontis]|uniref:Methanogenesis marker 16 metalloprotein n=1 Tax=Methanofollis fontis TaxID=2052832 RepID=A0A483CVP8_9EURY|nr:methanogenesis marker 16 metalloprotein [Methanofollis fontis]TAJ45591.1 methanogenesis marker 16 metalloprotein [Methanofollis fontis]